MAAPALADVDLADLRLFACGIPHEVFASLRRSAPVYRNQGRDGGFWALLRHGDVTARARRA